MSFFPSKSHHGGNATGAGVALLVAFSSAWAVDWAAPPDPLILPAPREQHVEFVPVFLQADDPVRGTAKFVMGMGGQSINESPTEVEVGGSFRTTRDGTADWFFYMAKTEVTADLFNAVMRSAGQPAKQFSGAGDLPAVGLTYLEVQNFLDAYNRWLSNKAGDVLPADEDGLKAFLRLPMEQEWEFAARGGRKVSADEFARKTPYGEEPLEEFEWFGGPSSSHNELQAVGKLKPNPLGLHDMLGNASEMTGSPFQLKVGKGQTGGLAKRGGNFRTRPEDLRSSLRGEFAQYDMSGDNKGVPELGFRLVLAAPIFPDPVRVGELEELLKEQDPATDAAPQSSGNASFGAPVWSTAHGLVVYARDAGKDWGNVVIVRHAFWESSRWNYADSFYAHLAQISVREGQQIKRGERLGSIGNNDGALEAHLHFEIRKNLEIGINTDGYPKDLDNYHRPYDYIVARRQLAGGNRRVRVALGSGFIATRSADGFDLPVGKPDAKGYQRLRGVVVGAHMGDDWQVMDTPSAPKGENLPIADQSAQSAPSPVTALPSTRAAEIKAPFQMKWGSSPASIKQQIDKSSAKIIHREVNADSREIWSVDGIRQEGLTLTRFFFSESGLEEIRLHYERSGWSHDRILRWVQVVKQQADGKYGMPASVSPENVEGDGRILAAWRWTSGDSSLLLLHYLSDEDGRSADQVVLGYARNLQQPVSAN